MKEKFIECLADSGDGGLSIRTVGIAVLLAWIGEVLYIVGTERPFYGATLSLIRNHTIEAVLPIAGILIATLRLSR